MLSSNPETQTLVQMAESSSQQYYYDVFLSFRGDETRTNFTSHLYASFARHNIRTFKDDVTLRRGDEISPSLLRAIKGSKISVIVLSKDYATSRWCLDELVKIMECKREDRQVVVPIFYHIDPSDVRKQTGSYRDAFAHHEQHFNKEKVNSWRAALNEVGNLSGWVCSVHRDESEIIEKIAKDLLERLHGHMNNIGGDIEAEIAMLKQRAKEQQDAFLRTNDPTHWDKHNATWQHIMKLQQQMAMQSRCT